MNTVKTKFGLILSILFGLFAFLIYLFFGLNKDSTIINHGIGFYKATNKIILVLLVLAVVTMIVTTIQWIMNKVRKNQQTVQLNEAKKDPLYEEPIIQEKLIELQRNTKKQQYKSTISLILDQIDEIQELQKSFENAIEDNHKPIIENIKRELMSIRLHIMQEAKSIYRRLLVEQDDNKITEKIKHNDKILSDANKLISEALNYVDVTTESTDVDLKNLTESLKELIELI